jgi:hypothetical protein
MLISGIFPNPAQAEAPGRLEDAGTAIGIREG